MVQIAEQAGVPLILANPGSNVRDTPPFKSEHRDGLTEDQLADWEQLRQMAADLYKTDPHRVIDLLNRASAIDDQYAGLHYQLGKRYDALGMNKNAYNAYLRAKELDVCPLRILEPMTATIHEVVELHGVPLVDVRRLLQQKSKDGLPGKDLYIDHVHPSIAGHRLIAEAFAERIFDLGLFDPRPGWKQRRDESYREHLASLPNMYYQRGTIRLQNLIGWAQGRAKKQHVGELETGQQPIQTVPDTK
jgi:hypothetical protein